MPKRPKKTREAHPGELREIAILERLERLSSRPETRMDVGRLLESLTAPTKIYAKHLVTSGPSSYAAAAKACKLSESQIEAAIQELETGISRLF